MQRFANTSLIVIILGAAILCIGCGGPKTEPREMARGMETPEMPGTPPSTGVGQITNVVVPDWFVNIPSDPNYLYAVETSNSKDMSMAINNAQRQATANIAGQIQTKVDAMFKRFREEVGAGEDAELMAMSTAVSKEIVSEVLNSRKWAKQEILKEGNLYNVYVLAELSLGQMQAATLDKVKAQKDMYTRFRASQGFQELEAEVGKYEEWKKENQPG